MEIIHTAPGGALRRRAQRFFAAVGLLRGNTASLQQLAETRDKRGCIVVNVLVRTNKIGEINYAR
jgi:hypothetical protein